MGNNESDEHELMMSMIRRHEGWSVIKNAANLIGHIMEKKSEEFGTSVTNALWDASQRLEKEIGLTSTLSKAFEIGALSTIEQAGRAAEHRAETFYILYRFGAEKEPADAFCSDVYSTLAVVCYARLGRYRENKIDQKIAQMAAFSYAVMVKTREDD
jgi:hypothetical protein